MLQNLGSSEVLRIMAEIGDYYELESGIASERRSK